MADNPLTLFCLVDGQTPSNAFPVEIESTKTVGHLKDLIKAKKANNFQDVDADVLTIWHVSIPADNQASAITIDALDDKTELNNPRTRLSKLFPESPDDNTYIIVQRRPAATPIPKRAIPFDSVENELTVLIEDANRQHSWHAVDAADVKAAQKEKLGPFYKKALPYGTTASSMNLAMLGMVLDKEPTSSDNRTLRDIVESDIGKTTGHGVVAMVGRSGSGKTATVIELAKKHFVVYCVCCDPRSMSSPDFKDPNFITLARDVERMCVSLPKPEPESLHDLIENDSALKRRAGDRVELEFLARLLFLQLLFTNDPDLAPLQFFREQTNGGATTIETLVNKLRAYDTGTISVMHRQVQNKLAGYLTKRGLGLVIALDEAQVAGSRILAGQFIAPSSLGGNQNILGGKNQVQNRHRRGFLTPLCATLGNVRATLVVLGTSLSLQDADHVYSAVGKRTNFQKITTFPLFDDQDVEDVLSELVDISDCTIPHAKRRKLTGRARFSASVVREIFELHHTEPHTKQTKLDKAFDSAIDLAKSELRDKVRDLMDNDSTGDVVHLLGRMVLAYKLQGGKIWFTSNGQADFMDKALCSLRMHSDGVHWLMDEPLVVEVVEEELNRSNVDPTFCEHLHQLNGIIENLGVKSSAKGNALEPLVRQSLRRFNNFYLADLPFLKGIELPTWCFGRQLHIDEINTAHGFGYGDDKTMADLKFLIDRPPDKLLVQQSGTRQDGAWFFSDNHYAGSLAIKFCSNAIPQDDHKENETSSDIRRSFLRADGTSKNPSLGKIRDDFVASGVPNEIKGILRIHLELPRVQGMQLATHVKRDLSTGTEDVMVYIDLSNMDDFFYEGVA
ncbi:hypothetical protein BGZ82_000211 [Podila clonocystis]|nr:hypothetical protein BGZ82_000211 [Podila clonocystis]